MCFLSHYLQRTLVFLLLTVFITNTVYASGVMAAESLCRLAENKIAQCHVADSVTDEHHCHHQLASDESFQHPSQQHPQHKAGCTDCNHCFACFTVIIPNHLNNLSNPDKSVVAIPVANIYLSPISAQPQKPPIV